MKLINLAAIVIYVLNAFLLYVMVDTYIEGNDKAIFILILGIPVLSLVNLITGWIIGFLTLDLRMPFKYAGFGLLILWFPILFIIPMYY